MPVNGVYLMESSERDRDMKWKFKVFVACLQHKASWKLELHGNEDDKDRN